MAAGQEQCADGHHALANPRYQEILRATVLTFARYGYRKTLNERRRARPHMNEFAMPASKYGAVTTAAEFIRDVDRTVPKWDPPLLLCLLAASAAMLAVTLSGGLACAQCRRRGLPGQRDRASRI